MTPKLLLPIKYYWCSIKSSLTPQSPAGTRGNPGANTSRNQRCENESENAYLGEAGMAKHLPSLTPRGGIRSARLNRSARHEH